MKRIATLLVTILFTTLCCTVAMAMEGEYLWQEHPIKVTSVMESTMFGPANMTADEYAVSVVLMVEEALWKDEALCGALYQEALLADRQGKTYAPQVNGVGTEDPTLVFFYCIPTGIAVEELSFVLKESESKDAAGDTGKAPDDGSVELSTADGHTIAFIPLETGAFQAQADKVIVHTRIGATVHNSGSQFLAGSALKLANMRNTKQYAMPMITFRYQTALGFDEAAEAIGVIGQSALLTLDGTDYPALVAWITEEIACFIFDSPELPSGTARFAVRDNQLVIEP
ncbi:MAG: hypothetical protein VB099_10905 [Candidatus Limiplasma sp.]|nr:hypothetical protein [Candidatus Limiplasma sp.]